MALSHFYFSKGASCYIAAVDLQACRELFLRNIRFFAKPPDVGANCLFHLFIHNEQILSRFFCT